MAKRRASLAGTGLYKDSRSGKYYWRKVDVRTGKRIKRCTHQTRRALAIRVATQYEQELREEQAGLRSMSSWRVELRPLADAWLEEQEGELSGRSLAQKRAEVSRALRVLRLEVAADLNDLASLDERLRRLVRQGKVASWTSARRSYQAPLRQFSKWLAANGRHLDRDPLASWALLREPKGKARPRRRAYLPARVARAFRALDWLDRERGRQHPQRPVFLAMLVTAPRGGAFVSRDVGDLDLEAGRIRYGEDVRNKRKGAGALDPTTAEELRRYVSGRAHGPLFLSPRGGRYQTKRLLLVWREAFSLGLVLELLPAAEQIDGALAHLVSLRLLSGRLSVSRGGNPRIVTKETREARRLLGERVERLARLLEDDWQEALGTGDLHSFRMTHRTWGEAKGVPPVLIDRQLGHSGAEAERSLEAFKLIAGSKTGRGHYLDLASSLLDAGRSAAAVRELLDSAEREVRTEPRMRALEDGDDAVRPMSQSG